MQTNNQYDTGSVKPCFHGNGHKLQLALLVAIEGEEVAQGIPDKIGDLVNMYLLRTGAALEADNAPDFVQNFRKEAFARYELRRIIDNKKDATACHQPHPERVLHNADPER